MKREPIVFVKAITFFLLVQWRFDFESELVGEVAGGRLNCISQPDPFRIERRIDLGGQFLKSASRERIPAEKE